MTWRFDILRDLHNIGLRGNLPEYIRKFLAHRRFKTRIGGYFSSTKQQENGVPQGSVLSVTLFTIKINEILNCVPREHRFISCLYVDDLQIGYRHWDLTVIQRKLQEVVNHLHSWTSRNGFKFSSSKTKIVHFHRTTEIIPSKPVIKLGNDVLTYSSTVKFLGLLKNKNKRIIGTHPESHIP